MASKPTTVMTTIVLTDDDAPHWNAVTLQDGALLVQTCDANIGIAGTRQEIETMLESIAYALDTMPGDSQIPYAPKENKPA